MKEPLRILYLEDDSTDVDLVQAVLVDEGIACEVVQVETRADFIAVLEQGGVGLILADYSLPSFDGISALAIANKAYPDVPFIVVSGVLGEELAIETLKSGATDYVLKHRLSRLVPSVHRALREAEERSERQQVKEKLAKSEAKFRSLIQNSSDIITILGSDGTIQYESPSIERVLGYKPDDLISKNAFDLIHPEDVASVLEVFNNLIQKPGTALSIEYRFQKQGGSWRFLESTGKNLLAEPPSVAGVIINSRDITERKQAEKALQQLNTDLDCQVQERTAQLQQALDFEATLKRITDKVRDSLDEGQILKTVVQELALVLDIVCCDTALYNLVDCTSTICYEYTVEDDEGTLKTPSSIGRVVQMADVPDVYRQLLQGQYFQYCDLTLDPIRSQVAVLSCPIVDDRGVLGDLWLFNHKNDAFDELELRLVQQVANQCAIAIRQARLYQTATAQVESLEKLNQLKDDFLSTVSHELRTPIANMKMALQMLKVSPIPERRERYLEILQAECTRESELINELLDLQRLEAGSYFILLNEAVNLQELLPSIIEPFRVRTGQRQQTLQINLPPDLPVLLSDRASLERILAELLNNACKYTPAGGEIIVGVCDKSTEAATIFTISNPAEIPADHLPRIFEKFYRVPKSDRWKQGGTGLGLALVQKLVEQLQGIIEVESSKGWTTFTVQLPSQPKA
jgi:PAS domain S-box-containing protein